jgi:hypothetical protein
MPSKQIGFKAICCLEPVATFACIGDEVDFLTEETGCSARLLLGRCWLGG